MNVAASQTTHPVLQDAIKQLSSTPAFAGLAELDPETQLVAAQNVRPFFCAVLAQQLAPQPLLLVAPTNADAQHLTEDLRTWLGERSVLEFPAWETLPFERVSPDTLTMGNRLGVLARLAELSGATNRQHQPQSDLPLVIVASVRAVLQCLGPDANDPPCLDIAPGDALDPTELVSQLVGFGYRREHQVEHRGEVAVRGGIIDVFGSTADLPIRIDLWGDEVERVTEFAISDQRSIGVLASARIFPARELRPDASIRQRARELIDAEPWGQEHWQRIADGELFDGMESWLPWLVQAGGRVLMDLLSPDAHVVLIEPKRLRDRALDIAAEAEDLTHTLAATWGAEGATEFPLLHVKFERLMQHCEAKLLVLDSTATASTQNPHLTLESAAWESVAGDSTRLFDQLRNLVTGSKNPGTLQPSAKHTASKVPVAKVPNTRVPITRVIVAAENVGSATHMVESLGDQGIPLELNLTGNDQAGSDQPGNDQASNAGLTSDLGQVVVAPFNYSFIAPTVGVAVLCEADFSGRRRTHRATRRRGQAQTSFEDLKPDDFVVHHQHGIARFAGLVHRSFGDAARDYLELQFRGTDRLYLPTDQIELIRPYIGGDSPTPSRMGGADFQKQKARVRSEVNQIAQELVVLYQKRLATAGHRFDADTPWLDELAASFAYVPTPDQQTAIDEVLADMASDSPMDRLICGDVGFGKTEIAVRATLCAVTSGKQVAVLVPTTLLAQQHHQTFRERLAMHSVRVEVLSRFLTPSQQRSVVRGLADGSVDVVIGTHRLLSQDVDFKDLGLLVIDEEQRFGVNDKEAMKHLKAAVDVLTLTATPIPRTLEMSLTGIRDLSLLQTPPQERRPILTHVGPYDERAVSEAIRRELLREGQAFFVHNRVVDIDTVAEGLRQLVPEARIAVAHGQMDEGSLESVVIDFWEGFYDVLVCTTIIESGIDMPSVNTLVVDRADLLGLGQLHQIRGRVGRSGQRAYAYLFYPENRVLTEDAYDRLRTIGEATQLGSGYRIAMRDLQIRGAGNLLSGVQSGHISAVGYDLYCELVSEAFAALRGEPKPEPTEISIELPVKAYLPDDYVPRSDQRLEAYRRLGLITELVEVADLEAEWLDRYGPVPTAAQTLLHIGLLRTECVRLGLRVVAFTASSARDHSSTGRLVLSPIDLSESEQVRLGRLANSNGFVAPRYKATSMTNSTDRNVAKAGGEVQLGVERMDADLPGKIFALLQELRPTETASSPPAAK